MSCRTHSTSLQERGEALYKQLNFSAMARLAKAECSALILLVLRINVQIERYSEQKV